MFFIGGGVLAGEGGVVVVNFSVEVRHGGVWDGCCVEFKVCLAEVGYVIYDRRLF